MKRKGGAAGLIAAILLIWWTHISGVSAISSSLVISQIQLGVTGATKQEFVQLHNNADTDIDITDWCLTYSDYKDETQTSVRCFAKPEGVDEVRVAAHGNILIASQTLTLPSGITTSERFAGSSTDLSGARGHLRIYNAAGVEIDKVAWDSKASTPPLSPETAAAQAPVAGKAIARTVAELNEHILIDTDNNQLDFHEQPSAPLSSDVYEYVEPKPVIDLCQLDGVQETMPDGYGLDEAGNCELLSVDVCPNLDKIQLAYPTGMLADEDGQCVEDRCQNIDGLQVSVPDKFEANGDDCMPLEDRPLLLSELLANASGADSGQEFIEIYNPGDSSVPLAGYLFFVGKSFEKELSLVPADSTEVIDPKSYAVFRDDELGFTLLNTTSGVRVVTPAGTITSETIYENPKDDMAWAQLGDRWGYTNQPTPGGVNQLSSEAEEEDVVDGGSIGPAPCGPGKYRHPITNRCRNIETDANVLATCDSDEYRNPETNRCRKLVSLASATLAACEEGYERNAETNRCRKVAGVATTLKACDEGYERNPETNRCRAATTSQKATALTPAPENKSVLNAATVGGVAAVAMGYAVYEWRKEISKGVAWSRAKFKR